MPSTLASPGSPETDEADGISSVSRGDRHASMPSAHTLAALDEWPFSPTEWHAATIKGRPTRGKRNSCQAQLTEDDGQLTPPSAGHARFQRPTCGGNQ